MGKRKETRFSITGIEYDGEEQKDKHIIVYLIENEDGRKSLSVEHDGKALEIPFDEILDFCIQGRYIRPKIQQYSLKALQEFGQQMTDEELLNEADNLEREMLAGHIVYDLPEDFFNQILVKGKLIEAERARKNSEQNPSDIRPDIK